VTYRALVLFLAAIGCGGAPRGTRFADEPAAGKSLVGAWDARLSLTRPYSLGVSTPMSSRICGTIGFVDNHRPGQDDATAVGVYDLDLARLGLGWMGEDTFPAALVSLPANADVSASRISGDSITIVLNPGSSERIVLLGRREAVGVDGEWFARSARGTASGSFSLRPHDSARRSC